MVLGKMTLQLFFNTNMGCLAEAFGMLDTKTIQLDGGVDNEGFKMIEDIVRLHNGNVSKFNIQPQRLEIFL